VARRTAALNAGGPTLVRNARGARWRLSKMSLSGGGGGSSAVARGALLRISTKLEIPRTQQSKKLLSLKSQPNVFFYRRERRVGGAVRYAQTCLLGVKKNNALCASWAAAAIYTNTKTKKLAQYTKSQP
jgi:hypothetical protein